MKLLRLATVVLRPTNIERWDFWNATFDNVTVQITDNQWYNNEEESLKIFIAAQVCLPDLPEVTEDGFIITPDKFRKKAEFSIESIANLISVAARCKRFIFSPIPYIALLSDNLQEKTWLDSTKGIIVDLHIFAGLELTINPAIESMNYLLDRLDGVALLAEALCQDHPMGKFREYIRFFERAFNRPVSQIKKKLFQFLEDSNGNYTMDEITSWVSLRNPAVHAIKEDFILEANIRPIIRRIEQAAYDILFNKETWSDFSKSRRSGLYPIAQSISPKNEAFSILSGARAKLFATEYDGFSSYPLDAAVKIKPLSEPSEWYSKLFIRQSDNKR